MSRPSPALATPALAVCALAACALAACGSSARAPSHRQLPPATPLAPITVPLAPAERLAPETDANCTVLSKALRAWDNAETAYAALLPRAVQEGWTTSRYHEAVVAYVNQLSANQGGGGGVQPPANAPSTNGCTCQTENVESQCAWYRQQGYPEALCDATRAHEQVHVDQCEQNKQLPDGDPRKYPCDAQDHATYTPAQLEALEVAAYEASQRLVAGYYYGHCATCQRLAAARAWTLAVNITYTRTNQTSYTEERLAGSAGYTARLVLPETGTGASVNGYARVWMGQAIGSAAFEDIEQHDDGKPYTGKGGGPLVPRPPLGVFTPEILRIHPDRCVYAFETSAAIPSDWSDGTNRIEGTHVQLGELPIEDGVATLAGSKTLALPVSHFDWPGPAATLPNEPIDWRARGQLGGAITISWSFTPAR